MPKSCHFLDHYMDVVSFVLKDRNNIILYIEGCMWKYFVCPVRS